MRTVVGVLRGGPSSEYEVSLLSGANVLSELDTEKYEPRDIFISKNGEWHLHGIETTPERALKGVDVAFNATHGEYGEDGQLQKVLDALGVPYTGSDAFASSVAFNKQRTKDLVQNLGLKTAHGVIIEPSDDLEQQVFDLFRSFPHPAIVKPVIGGSSVGTSKVESFHQLQSALESAFKIAPAALMEEYIRGKEATVGVIDAFRGEKTYALLPVEIIPPQSHGFFSYGAKYSGETIERVPGNFSQDEKTELMRLAKLVHENLALSHYSRSDFILSPRGIYFLEVNTLPGMTKESLFPKMLTAVGSKLSEFLDHVLNLARNRKTG